MQTSLTTLFLALCCITPLTAAQRASQAPPSKSVPMPGDSDASAAAAAFPAGFINEEVGTFSNATCVTFHTDGRVFVAEKGGRVFTAPNADSELGVMLDISEEIANWGDHGLVGLAIDPDFDINSYIYLYYAVDYHHLMNFGTPSYDPAVSEDFIDTIGRVTRYTADAGAHFTAVVPGSRKILVGESISTGIPLCSDSHGIGAIHFGNDGTLLVSVGDGQAGSASSTCLVDGIIQPKEDIFQYRAQLVDSLSGKLLRLDPETGDGIPGNPWFDAGAPRAAKSRVFALGLRQPFRFQVRPGTGSTNPNDGQPGTIFLSDVGQSKWEELNVIDDAGTNCGWPIYEGVTVSFGGQAFLNPNMDAPNPLFGQMIPGIGLCEDAFFNVQDLIANASLNMPMYVNPCDPSQPVVSSEPLHVHFPPVIEWSHVVGARVPAYDALGDLVAIDIGAPGTPVAGEPFEGNCASESLWYTGTAYPAEFQNRVFVADFARGWMRLLDFDASNTLTGVELFADPIGRIVSMAYNPVDEMIYNLTLSDVGVSKLNRIKFIPAGAPPVVALVAPAKPWGDGPLYLTFDAEGSFDPEGLDVSFTWDFGDGTVESRSARTTHVFPSTDITSTGTAIARIFELSPPDTMTVTSNKNTEVMRDGDIPAQGTSDPSRQYDTFHHDGNFVPDKGGYDWIGYEFPQVHQFVSVVFQEGSTFGGLGGWWNEVRVQVRQAGQWVDVTDINAANPPYPGEFFPSFELFEFVFDPVVGDAIRLFGVPGGTLDFVTVGEFRVAALTDPPIVEPTNYTVTVEVSDELGTTASSQTQVFLANTPPDVTVTSPKPFQTYGTVVPETITLRAQFSDAQSFPGELDCAWQVLLHHNDHVHPGPIDTACVTSATFSTDACDGDIHYHEVRMTVTDPSGLGRTRSVFLPPACDLNMNGVDDATDIATGFSDDKNLDNVPDELDIDCDENGLPDLLEIFFGTTRDENGDGIPDVCRSAVNRGTGKLPGTPGNGTGLKQ